jgi:hypothetical protein
MKLPSAYVLSNNGLGDNITMNGAVHFLRNYYETVFFLCKDIHLHQIAYLYQNYPQIVMVPFDPKQEFEFCYHFLSEKYATSDVFVGGLHTVNLRSKITHPELVTLPRDTSSDDRLPKFYEFIEAFYLEIRVPFQCFYCHFTVDIDGAMKSLYDNISTYKIIFVHSSCSLGNINLDEQVARYIDQDDVVVICVNRNYYPTSHSKYAVANSYINLPTVLHYIEIIRHAHAIHVSDSSISCMVLALLMSNRLETTDIKIYDRYTLKNHLM